MDNETRREFTRLFEKIEPVAQAVAVIKSRFDEGQVVMRSDCLETQQKILSAFRASPAGCPPLPRRRKPIEIVAGIGAIVIVGIVGITGLIQIISVLVGHIRQIGK